MPCRPLLAALSLSIAAALPAFAQDVRVYRHGELVDPQDVAAILDRSRPRMRTLHLLDDGPVAQAAAVDVPSALALPVQFGFDSAEILPEARSQLDALAEGIRQLPPHQAVLVEGHTDALGTEQYNEGLSLRRAHAVRRYLVAQHGIDPARLKTLGRGERDTLPGRDPDDPQNRRVQFRGE